MWYFLVKQRDLTSQQYQQLQTKAVVTEVELFNEPYDNWHIFSVEKDQYTHFMEHLDQEGIGYNLAADRPTRTELLTDMQ